ncbi:hypothetical protein F4W66_15410 [Escherichia coli]|nr:hypothetical protein F4W66_15410 [Escherichia coli]
MASGCSRLALRRALPFDWVSAAESVHLHPTNWAVLVVNGGVETSENFSYQRWVVRIASIGACGETAINCRRCHLTSIVADRGGGCATADERI